MLANITSTMMHMHNKIDCFVTNHLQIGIHIYSEGHRQIKNYCTKKYKKESWHWFPNIILINMYMLWHEARVLVSQSCFVNMHLIYKWVYKFWQKGEMLEKNSEVDSNLLECSCTPYHIWMKLDTKSVPCTKGLLIYALKSHQYMYHPRLNSVVMHHKPTRG